MTRLSDCVRALAPAALIIFIGANVPGMSTSCLGQSIAVPKTPNGPVNGTTTKITYTWALSQVRNVCCYDIYHYNVLDPNSPTLECSNVAKQIDHCEGSALAAGDYGWYLVEHDPFSAPKSGNVNFSVVECTTPAAPSPLTAPANNSTATSNTPTLSWTAASLADKYDIHLGTTNTPPVVATSTTTSFVPPPLPTGTYFWYIEAYPNCDTTKGIRSTETFSFTAPCPDAPDLQKPNSSSIPSGNITLLWSAAAGAAHYDVFVGINGATPGLAGTTTNTSLTQFVDSGTSVEWYVVSSVPSCGDKSSMHGHFTTFGCPNSGPTITAPSSGSSFDDSKPVTITWTAISGATSYDILISIDNGANYFQKATVSGSTLSTSIQFTPESYVVAIRANLTSCPPVISQPGSHFSVTPEVVCLRSRPVLVSPAGGAAVTLPVTFDWNDVAGATGYDLYVVTSTSTGPLTLVGSTTSSELRATSLPSNTQSWFVQALLGINCPTTESDLNNLTVVPANCGTQSTTLVSPANNAADVSSTVDFDWTDVAGAAGYRLLVGLNGATPAPIAVVTDSHFQTSLQSGSSVEWYVEVTYNTQCPAIASSRFKFTVQPVHPRRHAVRSTSLDATTQDPTYVWAQ